MQNLIIYAHPNPNSFNHAILEAILENFKNKKQKTIVRDLYALNFNPILKASDFKAFKEGQIPSDIKTEQDLIAGSEVITFIYPIWWAGLPAIIKGYIDRVFSYGFAYKMDENGQVAGLLKGKKALIINTTGTPGEIYDKMGMTEALKNTSDKGILEFTGLEVLDHIFFGAVPSVTQNERVKMLASLNNKLDRLF